MIEDLLTHSEWVRRLARSLAGDDATADDLVQETWIAASRRPPQLDRPVRPWLAVVVRNLFLKGLAREQRREAHHLRIGADGGVAGPSPEATLESSQLQRFLAELVAALDEPYRQTLILHYFEDQSAAEIARTQSIPAGTVRWRLKVARDELREVLDRRHAGDREVWRRALLPLFLAPVPRTPVPIGRAPVTLGLVGLVVAAALVRTCVREPVSTARSRAEPGASPAAGLRPPATGAAAPPAAMDRDQCRSAVTHLRREVAIAENEHLLRLDGEERFHLGEANPAAQQVIAPVIARILGGDGAAPSHSLDCRTWACRLLLLKTAQELAAQDAWQHRLRDDLDISERLDSFSLSAAAPTKDPVSKVPLYEVPVYLALADPSGQRLPRPRPDPATTAAAAPLPSTLEGCRRELALLHGRLAEARGSIIPAENVRPRGDWVAVIERRTKELEAQGKSEACAARFPDRGTLEVRFELSGARSSEPHLVARYGGALAGTPLGRCLTETVVEPVLSTPMPDPPLEEGVAFYPIVIH